MTNLLDDVIGNEVNVIKELENYSIEFGILTGDGLISVPVNVLNPDDTISKVKMNVADIMYFTEYGTYTIPGKFILEKAARYANTLIDDFLNNLDLDNINSLLLENSLRTICFQIESYAKSLMISTKDSTNRLGNIIYKGTKDDNKYLYDLKDLSKYFHCKLIKNK